MSVCTKCYADALVTNSDTGETACAACGIVQDFTNFHEQPQDGRGTYINYGRAGGDTDFSYRERKLYRAKKVIDDIAFRLNLEGRTREITDLVKNVTEGEFGEGNWFDVLSAACCYIVMRRNCKVLTMIEVCNAIGCELYEMGRMVGKVVDFLGLELPEFDVVGLLERTIRGFSGFQKVDKEKIEVMVKQGNFVVQCCIKWWLTTGRRPGQVAVAVLVFVAEVNGIKVRIEEVAKEVNVGVGTCKLRYKELLEALVEVAKGLPWGNDINVKNIMKNATFVMKYMEMKSMEEKGVGEGSSKKRGFGDGLGRCGNAGREGEKKRKVGNGSGGFDDFDDAFGDVFREDVGDGIDVGVSGVENGLRCDGEGESQDGVFGDVFREDVGDGIDVGGVSGVVNGSRSDIGNVALGNLRVSHEALANLYSKFKADFASFEIANKDEDRCYGDGLNDLELGFFDDWWSGESELCKKLFLEELEEKDVGFNPLPPSYIQGRVAVKRRREKIKAAKTRINSIRLPSADKAGGSAIGTEGANSNDLCLSENVSGRMKRMSRSKKRKKQHDSIDWEDFIIETLLLHKVKEEEIEKGHYKALLGLHVFNGTESTD